MFRSNVLALENAIRDPKTQIGGLVVLLDMSGLGFGHAKFLSPHLAKRTVEVIQEAFPMRFKSFHILHEPFYFDAILAILRPFLKEKIRNRVRIFLVNVFFISQTNFLYHSRSLHTAMTSSHCIATFQGKYSQLNMVAANATSTIPNGGSKFYATKITFYAWKRTIMTRKKP